MTTAAPPCAVVDRDLGKARASGHLGSVIGGRVRGGVHHGDAPKAAAVAVNTKSGAVHEHRGLVRPTGR